MGAEHRKTKRRHVSQPVLMLHDDGSIIGPCTILDVSAGGARLKLTDGLTAPAEFVLLISKFDSSMRRRCAAVWQHEAQVGIRFLQREA